MSSFIVSRFDLNQTRSEGDRKEYRLIKLQNGLECMLISTFNEQPSYARRPSSTITDDQEDRLRKKSIQDRRLTQTTNIDQSRIVREFSEERLKRRSDASADSHVYNQKTRSDTRDLDHTIEEEEERDEQEDEVRGVPSSHSPLFSNVKSSRVSIRDSSSKASGVASSATNPNTRPQSRQPSIAGVVSGEAGRKLSQIFPPPPLSSLVSLPESPTAQSSLSPLQHQSSMTLSTTAITSNAAAAQRGRTSVIESPRERPPALRLSRMVGSGLLEFQSSPLSPAVHTHSHEMHQNPSTPQASGQAQHQDGLTPLASPRTHRTSLRSNSMASTRALSMVFPHLHGHPVEADMCAVAMGVSVGSFATPEGLDGLAHFLEHMLFMGSEKFPRENEFDSLLARAGGTSNAYTDTERTVYHFSVPQLHLKECLKVFAQFFVSPLLLPEASSRELKSIESEFALRQNIDGCRLQEIWRETSRTDTPYSKFTCGNMQTLKSHPESQGINVIQELRNFYNKYYVSGNMKFVILSGENMMDLELSTAELLKDVRTGPPMYQSLSLASAGFPWKRASGESDKVVEAGIAAGCVFRIPPTHDMHEMQMTWQLPPQSSLYKSKPTEYLAHVLGHESAGSILAELKARGWATALMAGVSPEDGFTNNTGVTLFNVTISLTSAGLSQWIFVSGLVFEFIGILKRSAPVKWIHDELKEVAAMQYRFHEEPDPRVVAQRLCIHMLPQTGFEKDHLLTGSSLVFEWNPEAISQILERLEPETVRIDLISSRLHEIPTSKSSEPEQALQSLSLCERPLNREPIVEKYTGASYWMDVIPQAVIYSWRAVLTGTSTVGYAGNAGEELFPRTLSLPPKNPFISSDFRLKTIGQYDYTSHPLIGAEVRIKTTLRTDYGAIPSMGNVGSGGGSGGASGGGTGAGSSVNRHISFKSRKSMSGWDVGVVLAFDPSNGGSILVKFPAKEGVRRWHRLDLATITDGRSSLMLTKNKPFTLDGGKCLGRLINLRTSTGGGGAENHATNTRAATSKKSSDVSSLMLPWSSSPPLLSSSSTRSSSKQPQSKRNGGTTTTKKKSKSKSTAHKKQSTLSTMASGGAGNDGPVDNSEGLRHDHGVNGNEDGGEGGDDGLDEDNDDEEEEEEEEFFGQMFAMNPMMGTTMMTTPEHKNALWAPFPRVPSPESCPQPVLVSGSDDFFSLWFLHDTSFRSPRASAYLSFLTPIIAESPLSAALADLFAVLVFESLNQESYMAFIVDLDFEIQVTGGLGIQMHFAGFSHKLTDLLKIVLKRAFFFTQWVSPPIASLPVQQASKSELLFKRKSTAAEEAGAGQPQQEQQQQASADEFEAYFMAPDQEAPREFDSPIFYARLETLLTDYVNAGSRFRSGNQVSSVMFDLLCDGMWTPEEKAMAARSITPSMLVDFANKVFATTKVEGLYQGNVDEKDAQQFFKCVDTALKMRASRPIRPGMEPKLKCSVVPVVQEKNKPVSGWIHILEAVESPSHSVELFFQIGPDNPEDRVLASALEQLMREPLYSELRTKQQLGYSVKCGVRSVCGTLGFVVEITSDIHGPEVLAADVDDFLSKFKIKIEQMPPDEFVLNLCGLANQFLEKAKNLGEASSRHWNCILAHAFYGMPYVWNSNVIDAALIRTVATKARVLDAFCAWLDPALGKRRRASVFLVGYGYQVDQLVKSLKRPCVKLIAHPHGNVGAKFSQAGLIGPTYVGNGGTRSSSHQSARRSSVKCVIM